MKLSADQIEQVHDQTGVDPIPDDHLSLPELQDAFGDHTFYLDSDGLHIWEFSEAAGEEGQVIHAVRVASWTNEEKTSLSSHEPQSSVAIVKLAPDPMTLH